MIIHVTAAGDTITSIADRYGVETDNLLADNGLNAGDPLVVGEAIAVQIPEQTHIVQPGGTVYSIGGADGMDVRQLYRNNYKLCG